MKKYVTFVFDDGPNDLLESVVDKIASYGYKAGFAIIGRKINDETQKSLKYAIDNGFELVCHGQNHIHLEELNEDEMLYELTEPIKEIEKRLGYKITTARLPFLTCNDKVLEVARNLGLPLLGMGIDGGNDWTKDATPERISKAVLRTLCDGGIACLHVKEQTLIALDEILSELEKRDYILTTPKELFDIKGIKNIPLGMNIGNVNNIV